MYYIVTDTKIYKGKTVNEINRHLDGKVEHEQFKQIGADMILYANDLDLDFIRDTKRLSAIMFGNFFKKDKTGKYLLIANFIVTLIIFIRLMG